MVDGVELCLLHQLQQVRKLQRQRAFGGQHLAQTGTEVVDVWHVREHVVADHQIATPSLGGEALREGPPKNSPMLSMPLARAARAVLSVGSTPTQGTPRCAKYCSR